MGGRVGGVTVVGQATFPDKAKATLKINKLYVADKKLN